MVGLKEAASQVKARNRIGGLTFDGSGASDVGVIGNLDLVKSRLPTLLFFPAPLFSPFSLAVTGPVLANATVTFFPLNCAESPGTPARTSSDPTSPDPASPNPTLLNKEEKTPRPGARAISPEPAIDSPVGTLAGNCGTCATLATFTPLLTHPNHHPHRVLLPYTYPSRH